jgi:hypothetical protein
MEDFKNQAINRNRTQKGSEPTNNKTALYPDSHIFQANWKSLSSEDNKENRPKERTTNRSAASIKASAQPRRILNSLIAPGLAIS